jgi:uncharacterized protein involved in outer membrane biogenesis
MKALRVLAWMLLPASLLLLGAIAYLPVYLHEHKADLEAAAGKVLGRPVTIDGVTLGWLVHPRPALSIVLTGLRVANPDPVADWALGPHVLETERVDVSLDLGALLHRQVNIDQLVIRGARLMLQRTADGRDNWQLAAAKGKGADDISLLVPTVQVLDSEIAFSAAKGVVRRADVTRLQLDGLGVQPLALQAELVINETPLTLNASAGAADSQAGARWPFQVQARSADTRVELNGSAPTPFDPAGLDAKLQVEGPTASPLGQIAGIHGLPAGPFRLDTGLTWDGRTLKASAISGSSEADVLPASLIVSDGEISVSADGPWSLRIAGKLGDRIGTLQLTPKAGTRTTGDLAIKATLADGSFDGELRPASGDERALLSGTLKVGKVSFEGTGQGKAAQHDSNPDLGPAATKTHPTTPPTWLDNPLPFAMLTRLDADLDLAAEALTWQRITMRGPKARAKLRGGRLQLDGVKLVLPGLTLTGQAVIDAGPGSPALTLKLNTDRIDLAQALSMLGPSPTLGGSFIGVGLDARANGATPAALIRALSGTLKAKSARLLPPVERGRKATAIELSGPNLRVDAGKAVSFKTGLAMAGQALDLTLTGGTLDDLLPAGRSWSRIDVTAQTRIDRHRLSIGGHLGPLAAIRAGRDLMLDLTLADDTGLTGALDGELARLDGLAGNQLQARFAAKSLATLHPGLPAQPFSATARLEGQAGQITLLDLKASSAGSDLAGQVRIGLGERARIDADLNAGVLDLTPFMAPNPDPRRAGEPIGANGRGVSGVGRDSIDEQPLPLDGLTALDGSLQLRADQVQLGDFGIDNGTLDARLDAGHLVLSADAAQNRMSVDLELRPRQTDWRFDLHHKGNLNLGRLIKATNQQVLSSVPAAVEIRLSGVGASIPALLRSADGRVELILGAGQLDRKASKLPLGGLVFSLLDTLNPARIATVDIRRDLVSLRCTVLQFEVADGIATSMRGLALQTDNLNVMGGGAIKLETGEIALRFKAAKRTGVGLSLLGIADRFIIVTGTLKAPRATIDTGDLLVQGAAAWATSGLSLVADQIIGRLSAFGSPCEKVLRRDAPDPGSSP